MTPAQKKLIKKLLRRDEAHRKLLAAYRSGSLRAPGAAIDTLHATADVPDQIKAMLEEDD